MTIKGTYQLCMSVVKRQKFLSDSAIFRKKENQGPVFPPQINFPLTLNIGSHSPINVNERLIIQLHADGLCERWTFSSAVNML